MGLDDLKTPQHMECKAFATFASRLMVGFEVGGRFLQMHANNRPTSADDRKKFDIDAILTLDGEAIGALDVERKPNWGGGPWPYRQINIPYRPSDCFFDGARGQGRLCSKYRKLREAWQACRPGFWVAYSSPIADDAAQMMLVSRQACLVVPAANIFGQEFKPRLHPQGTRYRRNDGSQVVADVIALPNDAGVICFSESEFTRVVVDSVCEWMKAQEVRA
jgi:hypothetical protein